MTDHTTDSDSSSDPDWDEIEQRVTNSKDVLGHPHNSHPSVPETPPAIEGEHYEVVAFTDWGDYLIPTIVEWENGETDQFTDLEQSQANREASKELVDDSEEVVELD